MDWSNFIWFALPSAVLWLAAGVVVYYSRGRLADWLMVAGTVLFALFIAGFWTELGRPPMRTTGETRLWYSLFLSGVGYLAYRRWRYPWLLTYSAAMAVVFVLINILKPEIHSKNLMPALQSIWFVPHVASYMLSYAMLGAATIGAVAGLVKISRGGSADEKMFGFLDNTVYAGFGLLVSGMLMGAVWAKAAWGHYWTWDPKETWALATALACLLYIHIRLAGGGGGAGHRRAALWILIGAFVLLMITWLGVNYLPSARGSMHVY